MAEPHEINPYQSPEQVDPPPRIEPDKSINYPGGMWMVLLIGLAAGLLATGIVFTQRSNINSSFAGVYLYIAIYFAAFIVTGLLLPHRRRNVGRELLLRSVGSVLLSIALVVLYVPTCGFSMFVTVPVFGNEDTAMAISSMIAFVITLLLGATRIRAIVRSRHAMKP